MVPTETVIVAGTKAKPDIATSVEAGVGLGVGVGVDGWQDMPNVRSVVRSTNPMTKGPVMLDFT